MKTTISGLGLAALLLVSGAASAQILGTASQFAVLGATPSVTNTGATLVLLAFAGFVAMRRRAR